MNPSPHASAALRVLVTDDDALNLRIAARLLRELGHSGALANNGQIALDMLARQPFDLLLLDLSMPVLDGMGTLAALRERRRQGRPQPPVILITGHDLAPNWAYYRDAGAAGFVQKPLSLEALAAALQRL